MTEEKEVIWLDTKGNNPKKVGWYAGMIIYNHNEFGTEVKFGGYYWNGEEWKFPSGIAVPVDMYVDKLFVYEEKAEKFAKKHSWIF